MTEGPHLDRLLEAIAAEAGAHRALLDGDGAAGAGALRQAAALYRQSWELAPPASYGRLIGMLKAAVLAGDASAEADYALQALPAEADSPPAAYARTIALLIAGDDAGAAAAATAMRAGSPAFVRAADAVTALASADAAAYAAAVAGIVADFEAREAHLTGVPIADTALMLERLADARGLAAGVRSPLLPG
jgi:hypothetical protein